MTISNKIAGGVSDINTLKESLMSANIDLNGVTASQIQDIMMSLSKEKEKKVLAVLGEPKETTKSGREGVFYRYKAGRVTGLKKDILARDRADVINRAYQVLFGEDISRRNYTVEQVYEDWHKKRKTTVCSSTYHRDARDWNNLKDFPLMKMRIRDINAPQLIDMMERYCGDHLKTDKDVKNKLSLLRGIWQHGVLLDAVTVMVPDLLKCKMFKTKQPKSRLQKEKEVYTQDELSQFRQYLWKKERDIVEQLILFASYSEGARISEFRAVTWDDYDPETNELSYNHIQVRRDDDRGHKYSAKDVAHTKGYGAQGQRGIILIPKAVSILEEMRRINGNKHYIFQTSGQFPPSENKVNERLRKICDTIGIRYFPSHKLRFRFVSDCYQAKMPERAIQSIVGHSDIKTTQAYDRSHTPVISREQMVSVIDY